MAEGTKYSINYIYETPPNPVHPQSRDKGNDMPWENNLYIANQLDGKLPGAFYLETNMVLTMMTKAFLFISGEVRNLINYYSTAAWY